MATSYPTSLDTFTNPTSSDSLSSPSHSGLHADTADAIEALQVKVGINSSTDTSSLEYRIAQLEAAGSPMKKVARFTASGTWTVPTGVTYAVAHILGGGGGGGGQYAAGSAGGDSSVAFAGGTVTGFGGQGGMRAYSTNSRAATNQAANSGRGGMGNYEAYGNSKGFDAQWIVAGDDVTPGASITVTVGAAGAGAGSGATAGGDGGSGYVWIEYQES